MSISTGELKAALEWRYATKKFDASRRIPSDIWGALEESLVLAPSSFGLQPWKFLVVEDPAIRAQLAAESWNQPQVTEASHFVVLTARLDLGPEDVSKWVQRMAEIQGTPLEALAPFQKVVDGFIAPLTVEAKVAWNTKQVYIALGQLMTSAALLGIDTCPLEGLNPVAYDRILGLEGSGYLTAVACALGYRSDEDKYATAPKARFPLTDVVRHIGSV